ncbi:MBL fold metallo-hydrolase [Ruegeria marina]|uniref:Glyoxylase, beta-lactamase superfamily II n=1 Tax=Ruegeria marina TaxID=639004 RepID=A0A1G6Q5K5_9RHOB|nr:MBL fold metallo-hydrolase [Ruegeria marina]SDC87752.1 Glyoxylase, beta-lactamase superfamily II [Ruegeria marina]
MAAGETFRAGPWQVTCLVDGGLTFGAEVFPEVPAARQAELLARAGLAGAETEFNAYVLRHDDGRVWLVDTGCGAAFGPAGGHMPARLAEMGIAPGDVSRVIFTHLHGDHCGGALVDCQPVYAAAEVVLHAREAAHWRGTEGLGGQVLAACGDSLRCVGEDEDLGDGIVVWALPGHTPGHMGLRIGEGLVLAGDIVHSEALQLPDPRNATKYDVDGSQALASRHAALAEIADKGLVWAGSHMIGAKFARLERSGDGYAKLNL